MKKNVYLDPKCLASSLIPSAIEEYHKETSGYLIGSNGKIAKKLKVISAYPIQTDIKKRTFVVHGNESAVKRVSRVMETMKMRLVGGFHTHPLGPNKLSKTDIDFVLNKIEEHSLPEWLELILSIKKRDYKTEQKIGWSIKEWENKLGMNIKTGPWTGYNITLSGYWIKENGKVNEATLWTSKRYNF